VSVDDPAHSAHTQGYMAETVEKIQELLEAMRPAFQRDRGDIEFVSFNRATGVVGVRLKGMCRGCGMAELTLKWGVEETLKEHLPEVRAVTAVPEEALASSPAPRRGSRASPS
jgi:Fe-S cluster biogenesis protein NfuA